MKITRTCDGCKQLLRSRDNYEPLNDPKYKNLCKECFDKWLSGDNKLEVENGQRD